MNPATSLTPPLAGPLWPAAPRWLGIAVVASAHIALVLLLLHQRQQQHEAVERAALTVALIESPAAAQTPVALPAPPATPAPAPPWLPPPVIPALIQPAAPQPSPAASPAPAPPTSAAAPAAPVAPAPAAAAAPAAVPTSPPPRRTVPASAVSYRVPPAAELPRLSRRAHESGTVWLRVVVDVQGLPAQIALHRSSGFARLDEQALQAMRVARFQPHLEDGRPVEVEVIAPIEYPAE